MSSWVAVGEPLRRIKHAIAWPGGVEWDDHQHIAEWLATNVDRTHHASPKRAIANLLDDHINRRAGEVRGQKNPADGTYDAECWYYALPRLDGRELFVKFVIDPDEPEEPGIVIVSIHWQPP